MCALRVPGTLRASRTCRTTSLQSSTLYSSAQMRFDCPFAKMSWLLMSRKSSSRSAFTSTASPPFSSYASPARAALARMDAMLECASPSFGRLRVRREPNVDSKLSADSRSGLFALERASASTSRPMGTFLRRSTTEYGSAALVRICSRNASSSSGATVRVLPNQRRSACTRPVWAVMFTSPARSPIWSVPPILRPFLSRMALPVRYILRRSIVDLSRRFPPLFFAFRDAVRCGLSPDADLRLIAA